MYSVNAAKPLIVALAMLLVALGGCADDENRYGGVGIRMVTDYLGEPLVYYRVWSQEYPPDNEQWDGGAGTQGICGGHTDPSPRHNNCFASVLHCSNPEMPHREYGNHLREGLYLQVTLYVPENVENHSWGREGTPGEEIGTWRWDDLQCFKGYTLVLHETQELSLYRCANCMMAEEREGNKPLSSTGGSP